MEPSLSVVAYAALLVVSLSILIALVVVEFPTVSAITLNPFSAKFLWNLLTKIFGAFAAEEKMSALK